MKKSEYTIGWNVSEDRWVARDSFLPQHVGLGTTPIKAFEALMEVKERRRKGREELLGEIRKNLLYVNLIAVKAFIDDNCMLFNPAQYDDKDGLIFALIDKFKDASLEQIHRFNDAFIKFIKP
jgi:hypothetical protein